MIDKLTSDEYKALEQMVHRAGPEGLLIDRALAEIDRLQRLETLLADTKLIDAMAATVPAQHQVAISSAIRSYAAALIEAAKEPAQPQPQPDPATEAYIASLEQENIVLRKTT